MLATLGIGVIWGFSPQILSRIVPETEVALMAGQYLRILLVGAWVDQPFTARTCLEKDYRRALTIKMSRPGYALFEAGKKFVQCQGIYHAGTAILLALVPLNAVMTYVLVWHKSIGYDIFHCVNHFLGQKIRLLMRRLSRIGVLGAAISIAISSQSRIPNSVLNANRGFLPRSRPSANLGSQSTDWLMPLALVLYVRFIKGSESWNGLTKSAFRDWGPMLRLAVPGIVMIEAEFFAFELLTLFASYFGTRALAAQAVLATLSSLLYQVPFAIGIASCMRVGHYVGGGFSKSAKISSKAALLLGAILGVLNCVVLILAREHIGFFFTDDTDVISEYLSLVCMRIVEPWLRWGYYRTRWSRCTCLGSFPDRRRACFGQWGDNSRPRTAIHVSRLL